MQMPILRIQNQSGHTDVSVTTINNDRYPEQGWVSPILPTRRNRNVAMFPLRIINPEDGIDYFGPKRSENPELFVQSSFLPNLWMMKDTVRITVMNQVDDIIRTASIAAPIIGLVENNEQVALRKGREYQVASNLALFDKTGMPNNPGGDLSFEKVTLFIEIDPMNRLGGFQCNTWVEARFYSFQVRHGSEVDIP